MPRLGRARASLAALLGLVLPASALAAPVVGHVRVALEQYAQFPDYAQTAARNGYVILQPYQTDKLHALKAANPNVKVLMYENAGAASTLGASKAPDAGESYDAAKANGWLLHDSTTGQPFNYNGYPQLWGADVGNPGYQDAWAGNVLARLRSDAWDGVFMDDVDATMKYNYANPQNIQEYPTDEAYAGATGRFLAAVGPRLKAAGQLVVANIGAWVEYPDAVRPWLPYLSGAMDEKFLKWGAATGQGYRAQAQWLTQEAEIRDTEAAGDFFLGVADSDANDESAATYDYASALLMSAGHSYVSLAHDYATETWFPEYDLVLGGGVGFGASDPNGIVRRVFSQGLVLVNPTDAPLTADFGGVYSGSGLTGAHSATLPAHTGLVLTEGPVPITAPENFPLSSWSTATRAPAPRRHRTPRLVARGRHALRVQAEALGMPPGARAFSDGRAEGRRAVRYARPAGFGRALAFRWVRRLQVRAQIGCRSSARLVVQIDGRRVMSRSVRSRHWTTLSARLRHGRPLRSLSVTVANRPWTRGCAGGLRLDALVLRDR